MAILTEQRERRDAQPVPTEATEAAEKFVCGVYRCNLSGKTCRDYHAQAKVTRSMAREACIDCAAGAARLVLLGDGDTPGIASLCLERTAKGMACTNAPIKNGYCHIHRKDRIQMPAPKKAPAAKPAARTEHPQTARPEPARKSASPAPKKPARAPLVVDVPVDVEIAVEVSVVAPPAPVKIDMAVAKAAAVCHRPSCGRPAPGTGKLGEYCRQCANAAYMTLKKGMKGVPTDEDRRKWLEQTPVNHRLREILAKARRGEPTGPVVDDAVAVVGEAAPQAVEAAQQHPDAPAAPDEETTPLLPDDLPFRSEISSAAIPLAPSEVPPHLVVIMLPLNRRAFAELERLAAAGLDGDDPADVARTLVLEGLRRRAVVRP